MIQIWRQKIIFPGLKKLGKEFNFKNNKTFLYGFIKNTYVMFADGANTKNVWFRFPEKLDEADKQKILSWQKKGYAKIINFFDDNSFETEITFTEYFIPYKVSKIKEVIEDITNYIYEKYPSSKVICVGENCSSTEISIYELNEIPMLMCSSCADRLQNEIENNYSDADLLSNNYLKGFLFSAIFSIPGILLNLFFFLLGRISAVTGLFYYFLAQKGYLWAKGKFNKIGVLIISVTSFVFTVLGTYISYIGYLLKKILTYPDKKGYPIIDLLRYIFEVIKEPEVKRELLGNIYISLFICGICIVINTISSLKATKKIKVKELDK